MGPTDPLTRWIARLREAGPPCGTGLSPTGAAEAWNAALDALDPAVLAELGERPGRPWRRVAIVAARGAFTAPIEWCAAFLAAGSSVGLKCPAGDETGRHLVGLSDDLPFEQIERPAVREADLAVAMGANETVARIAADRQGTTLCFGHRFSAAWITGTPLEPDPLLPQGWSVDPFAALAADLALYDTRGCLSPALVLTPRPPEEIARALAPWMAAAQARWPRGEVSPATHADIRARRALARATTGLVVDGDGWSIFGLLPQHVLPVALPRVAIVHQADLSALAPWAPHWSTLGVDAPHHGVPPTVRVCRIGRMQRPPLTRLHDGVDWLAATRQA